MKAKTLILLAALAALPAQAAEPATGAANERGHGGHGPAQTEGAGNRRGQDWTRYPLIVPAMKGGADRMGGDLALKNIDASQVTVYAPSGQASKDFPVAERTTRIEALGPKLGNFQWVAARQAADNNVTVASTAYAFNNPGPAPTEMLLERRNELEIIPQPLPREHSSYRESEKWKFLVRFQGHPLPGEKLSLETQFGTRTSFVTGPDGVATVLFPRDFRPAAENAHGGHAPPRAQFVLAAEHDDLGKHYLSAFNYAYGADPDRERSLAAGLGFGLLGMLLAAPLWRHKKENAK